MFTFNYTGFTGVQEKAHETKNYTGLVQYEIPGNIVTQEIIDLICERYNTDRVYNFFTNKWETRSCFLPLLKVVKWEGRSISTHLRWDQLGFCFNRSLVGACYPIKYTSTDSQKLVDEFIKYGESIVRYIVWWINESNESVCDGIHIDSEFSEIWKKVSISLVIGLCSTYPRDIFQIVFKEGCDPGSNWIDRFSADDVETLVPQIIVEHI